MPLSRPGWDGISFKIPNHSRILCNPIPQENGMFAVPCAVRGLSLYLRNSRFGFFGKRQIPGWKWLIHGLSLRDGNAHGDIPGVLEGTGPSWSCPSATTRVIPCLPHSLGSSHQDFPSNPNGVPRAGNGGHFAPILFLSNISFLAEGEDNSSLQNS